MKQKGNYYQTFIKILFEGVFDKSLSTSEDDYLYQGSRMTKIEMGKIIELYEQYRANKDKSFPSFLLYSRCFLSFSKEKNMI